LKRIAHRLFVTMAVLSLLLFTASGCRPTTIVTPEHTEHEHEHHTDEMPSLSPVTLSEGEKLKVVATTSIVADVVQNVGGDLIDLTVLVPLGADPHAFEPTPQDAAAVADAHVVFVNGAGLEVFLGPLLESAGEGVTVVPVSDGIELRQFEGAHAREHEEREEEYAEEHEKEHEEEGGYHRGGFDPHTWFDPHNVIVWTHNIEHTLSTLDPDNAEACAANASAYEAELQELDAWIREQLAQVPEANRKLVTDHTAFSYFVHQYGFEQIGALFPGYSTLAEPSAQDLAVLEDAIREFDARAVFVGLTVNPDLAQRVTDDTGTQLVFLYTGSLSEPGGPADDYLSFMRYNVSAIAEALR
jgi:manganese/iron transport system substrate-binding protein